MSYVTINGVKVDISRASYGGDSRDVSAQLQGDVLDIFSTVGAFAALKADGSVVTWGGVEGLVANEQWFRDSSDNVTMSESGINVGIGRLNPIAMLEVSGTTLLGHRDTNVEQTTLLFYGLDTYGRNSGLTGLLRYSIKDIRAEAIFSSALYNNGLVKLFSTSSILGDLSPVNTLTSVKQIVTTPLQLYALNTSGNVYAYSAYTSTPNVAYDPNGAISINGSAQTSYIAAGSITKLVTGIQKTFTFSFGVRSALSNRVTIYCSQDTYDEVSIIGSSPNSIGDISGITGVEQIHVSKTTNPSHMFVAVLYTDGQLKCFGVPPGSFTTIPAPTNQSMRIIDVAVGEEHLMVRRANGTVSLWNSAHGTYTINSIDGLTDIISISSGYRHVVAITKGYTTIPSGSNTDGQINIDGATDIDNVFCGYDTTFAIRKQLYHRINGETRLADVVSIGRRHYGDTHSQLNIFPEPHHVDKTASVYIGSNDLINADEPHYSRVILADSGLPDSAHQWTIGQSHTAIPNAYGDHQLSIQHSYVGDVRNILRIDTCGNIGIGNTSSVITHLVDIRGGDVNIGGNLYTNDISGIIKTASQPFIQELGTHVGIGKTWSSQYHLDVSGTTRVSGAIDICGESIFYNKLRVVNGGVSVTNNVDISGTTTIDGKANLQGSSGVWVKNNLDVSGTTTIDGKTNLQGSAGVWIKNNADISGNLYVDGKANLQGSAGVWIKNNMDVSGTTTIDGKANLQGSSGVWVKNSLDVSGTTTIDGKTNLQGSDGVWIKNSLDVSGTTTIDGKTNLQGSDGVWVKNNLDVSGITTIDGKANLQGSSGVWVKNNLDVSGTATITGSTTICGTLYVNNILGFTGSQWVTNSSSIYYNTGNVGIGVTNPSAALDVNGTISATTLSGTLSTASQPNITSIGTLTSLNVSGNSTHYGTTELSGNVGIGKSVSLTYPLDVSGDINFSGSLYKNGVLFSSGGGGGGSSQWTTSGTEIYYDLGNVGIGVGMTNPEYTLDVSGTIKAHTMFANTIQTGSTIVIDTVDVNSIIQYGNNTLVVDPVLSRVGIGTSLPSTKLEVIGDATIGGRLYADEIVLDGETIFDLSGSDDYIQFGSNNTLVADIANTRVGIGKTNPSCALDVSGVIRASDIQIATTNMILDTAEANLAITFGSSNTLYIDTANDRIGIGTSIPRCISLQVNDPVDNWYPSFDVSNCTSIIYGPSGSNPTITGSTLNATVAIVSTSTYGRNKGSSLAFCGRAYNYSGSYIHMPFARITGTQQNARDDYGGDLVFEINGNNAYAFEEAMRISSLGYVGIGTTGPVCPLEVGAGVSLSHSTTGGYLTSTGAGTGIGSSDVVSIKSTNFVWSTGGFIATSDIRIKTNIHDMEDPQCLAIINSIEPKTYEYIDKLSRGNNTVYGFIAQQVRSVLPPAVTIQKDFIPNIYCVASRNGSQFIIRDPSGEKDLSGLLQTGDNVKLYDTSNNPIQIIVESIDSSNSFTFRRVSESDKLLIDSEYFVYGKEVDDFHALNKDYIFTINVCATQELSRKVDAYEQRIAKLEEENAILNQMNSKMNEKIIAMRERLDKVCSFLGVDF
jgi:hypothetical protein